VSAFAIPPRTLKLFNGVCRKKSTAAARSHMTLQLYITRISNLAGVDKKCQLIGHRYMCSMDSHSQLSLTNSYFYTVHWRAGIVSFFCLKERLAAANVMTECVKTSRLKK
jgi:hypothetical protein